jgi:hypothetical protein
MSKDWLYEGKPFTPDYESLDPEYVGFVYQITDNETGETYIGQKRLHKPKTLPKTKTRKRRVKTIVESDWRNYWSSNDVIKERVAGGDTDRYTREILRFGYSKGDLSYLETVEQIERGVLFTPKYLNGIINCRIHQKHISERLKKELGYGNQPEKP